MRTRIVKIVSTIIIVAFLMNLVGCSCSVFDRAGNKVADEILSDATAVTSSNVYDPNGTILYEDVLLEGILEEQTLEETQLQEQLLAELMLEPELLQEDVRLESIRVEIIDSEEYLYDDLCCDSYYTTQLDYTLIHNRFSAGASLVIAEVTFDVGALVVDIVCANVVNAAIDAGQIVLTVGTTTLSAFIAYHVAMAKSLQAGNSYEVALYDALDSASTAFYYASVIVDVFNAVISLAQAIQGIIEIAKTVRVLLAATRGAIVNAARTIAVTQNADGTFEVIQNGRRLIGRLAADSSDIYDPSTGKYICSLVSDGSGGLEVVSNTIPTQISRNGRLAYRVDDATHEIYAVTQNSAEIAEETLIGIVDEGGFVYNAGNIVSRIDFSSGKLVTDAYSGLGRLGITTNVFGDLLDSSGSVLVQQTVNGTVSFVNSEGDAVLKIYNGADGFSWLQNVDNGRTVGRLSEDGLFDYSWHSALDAARNRATSTVRKALIDFIQSGEHSDSEIRRLFPSLTLEQIDYIRTYGKLPEGIDVHHCYNVANYPDMAGDITNLEFLTREEHQLAHGGNFQSSTNSRSINYVDLSEVLDIAS